MSLEGSKSFIISNCYRRVALDEVSEQNNSNDHDKMEEIRQDNIEAANKYQSKYRRRVVVEDTDSDKQIWCGT
jgi:hypothetical protein